MLVGRFILLALICSITVRENSTFVLAGVTARSAAPTASRSDQDPAPSDDSEMPVPLDEEDLLPSVSDFIGPCAVALPQPATPLTRFPWDRVSSPSCAAALLCSLGRLKL
jgi:hypothetical protein